MGRTNADSLGEDATSSTDVEARKENFLALFVAEFLATAILMFIGCMGCMNNTNSISLVMFSFTFALAILISIEISGKVSGCHMNPAVTIGLLILGKLDWKTIPIYFLGEFLGSFAGFSVLWFLTPDHPAHDTLCALKPHDITDGPALLIEILGSGMLFLAISGLNDKRSVGGSSSDTLGIRVGFVVAGIVIGSAGYTGAGLNPARALPSAVLGNVWDSHWIYHVGPLLGMCLAAVLYRFVLDISEKYSIHSL